MIGGTGGAAARLGLKRKSLVSTMRRLGIVDRSPTPARLATFAPADGASLAQLFEDGLRCRRTSRLFTPATSSAPSLMGCWTRGDRKLLVDVVSAIRTAGEHNVLIDRRAAAPTRLSSTDLWKLGVAAGTQPALARGRVGLLVPLDKKDAEFFQSVARLEGANVKAFSDFESAISWIIMREQSEV